MARSTINSSAHLYDETDAFLFLQMLGRQQPAAVSSLFRHGPTFGAVQKEPFSQQQEELRRQAIATAGANANADNKDHL